MGIQHNMSVEGRLLIVEAWGKDDSLEDVKQYGLAIIEAAVAAKCTRVLCDERRLQYDLDLMDNYDSATYIAELAPKVARIAIVCAPAFADSAEFWETVVINRGLQLRFFNDMDQARLWLGDGTGF
jgi:hypothetical protein